MKIFRMTDLGKTHFIEFLNSLRTEHPLDYPKDLLSSPDFAKPIGGDTTLLDELNLDDRFETAKGLDAIVNELGISSAEKDWGFWTWCSLYLFERLCYRGRNGEYKTRELPAWIAEPHNWQRYYRHYLASIWRVYTAHKKDREHELVVLLNGPVNTPGELWAQIAATQTLITNGSMIDAVYHLYWDKVANDRKKGAGGSSPRRLTKVLRQFEKTYDFFSMSGTQIVGILPREFDRFKEIG